LATVGFKNIGSSEYEKLIHSDKKYLLPCTVDLARQCSDELYYKILTQKVTMQVNYELIHPDNWGTLKINTNDVITVTPALESGRWGAMAMIIIGAALIAFAPYLGGHVAGFLSVSGGAAAVSPYIVGIGLSLALGGISSLLFRTDLPTSPSISNRETQTYSWSGMKTMARSDMPVPVIYGTHMVPGNIISLFTEGEGESNVLFMLIALGEGEIDGICQLGDVTSICSTSDQTVSAYRDPAIYIDDQPITNYDNLEWWYRKGTNTEDITLDQYNPNAQNAVPNFDGARVQYDDGRTITTNEITYTTTKEVDAVKIQVRAPALFSSSSSGGLARATATYKVRFGVVGGSLETLAINKYEAKCKGVASGTTTPNANNIAVRYANDRDYVYGQTPPRNYKIHITQEKGQTAFGNNTVTKIENKITFDISEVDSSDNLLYVLEEGVTVNRVRTRNITEVAGNESEVIRSIQDNPVSEIYTTIGVYEVKIGDGVSVDDEYIIYSESSGTITEIPIEDSTKTGVWSTVTINFNTDTTTGKGQYDIKVSRTHNASDAITTQDDIYLHSVTEIVNGQFIYPNTALLGLKITATDQLSGGVPNIKTLVRGTKISVPNLSGSEAFDSCYYNTSNTRFEYGGAERTWDGTFESEWSNNSMLCVRDILLNERYGLGRYISSSDLSSSGISAALKVCHTEYLPPGEDFLPWWSAGGNVFDLSIAGKYGDVGIDSTNTKVTLGSNTPEYSYQAMFKLSGTLLTNTSYTMSLTLGSMSISSCAIKIYFRNSGAATSGGVWKQFGDTLVGKGDGTHTITSSVTLQGCDEVAIYIREPNKNTFTGEITDVSVSLQGTPTLRPHFHEWDGIIESGQSAIAVLYEMCDAFRCWPIWKEGTFDFVIDQDDTPIHTVSMGNIVEKSFNQSFTPLSEIPHRLIGQFTDSDRMYEMRSIIANSKFTDLTKINEKTIGLKGITNITKATREIKWKLNKVTNCTHVVNFKTGMDSIHATAGDIINVQHQLPAWGQGGRILSYTWDGSASKITIDEPYTFVNVSNTFTIKYPNRNNVITTATISTAGWSNGEAYRELPLLRWVASPAEYAAYAVGKSASLVKPFRIISARRTIENEVEITGLEHLSALYTEDSITVVNDSVSELPKTLSIPGRPANTYAMFFSGSSGVGLLVKAEFPKGEYNTKEIVVQLSKGGEDSFKDIGIITKEQTSIQYFSDSFIANVTYNIKFFCRTTYKSGPAVIHGIKFYKELFKQEAGDTSSGVSAPTGLRVEGSDPNIGYFKGRDVTIQWNGVSAADSQGNILGYRIEIGYALLNNIPFSYRKHNPDALLRVVDVSNTEYTYTLDNILEDGGKTLDDNVIGSSSYPLDFTVYTIGVGQVLSIPSKIFRVYNSIPSMPTSMSARSVAGGVQFSWKKSSETDLKAYYYRTQVGSEGWSGWLRTTDNFLTRMLTPSEVSTSGSHANIQIEVKAEDLYSQLSTTGSTNANSTEISDSLFRLIASSTVGNAASISELYDSIRSSGGIRIT